MWQKGRQTWIRTTAYSRIQAKKQGSVQFSRPAFRMDFKGGENPFLMAREGHRKPPRHPSVRNIAKSGKGHFTGFSGRKDENIGLFEDKVRMFAHKSTDVLCGEVRCFRGKNGENSYLLPPIICIFQRGMGTFLPFSRKEESQYWNHHIAKHRKTASFSLWNGRGSLSAFLKVLVSGRGYRNACFTAVLGKVCNFRTSVRRALREKKKAVPAANCTDTAKGIM